MQQFSKKNIVICCDGTCGEYGDSNNNTNVVRLFERLGADGPKQIAYYDPGVGTYNPRRTALGQWRMNTIASISGAGLRENVLEAYRYLMANYEPGDRVFLFGYSRGAHTVRVLAGMLYTCGLLTKGSDNLVPYMARIAKKKNNESIANKFRDSFARQCTPHLIGVWDSVASMGWLGWRKYYHNTQLNPDIKYAYQALSVDEQRWQFQPSIWDESSIPQGQTIEQAWFAGRHTDVGGQKVQDRGIPDIPLVWMLEKTEAAGLILRENWRDDLRPNPMGKFNQSLATRAWAFLFRKRRVIRAGDTVHESVSTRISESNGDYAPSNVPESAR